MSKYVDRSGPLDGENRTVRDSRIPYTSPRVIENFRLPDKKARRRLGYSTIHKNVRTQALAKHTGHNYSKRLVESSHNKGTIATTPLSYGLIRYRSDLQLRRAEPKTIEFCFRAGDIQELKDSLFSRVATTAGGWTNHFYRYYGPYLIDQTLLSNGHIFDTGFVLDGVIVPGTTYDMTALAGPAQFDALPITAFAVSYTDQILSVQFDLVESTGANIGRYWRGLMQHTFAAPLTTGQIVHVSIVYDPAAGAAPGAFYLYINGVQEEQLEFPVYPETLLFAGEFDIINGVVYLTGQKRDIVLLNECTARASYSSTCKLRGDMHAHQTFYHDFTLAPNTGINPWAMSPPRGTAIWDLRYYAKVKTSQSILDEAFVRLPKQAGGAPQYLISNWWLNDGGPVCYNQITNDEHHYCTVHHGYPGYVNNSALLGGLGIKLGDGQHIIKSTTEQDRFLGSGFASVLDAVFDPTVSAVASLTHRDQHSFSVMMQIQMGSFQAELNDQATDPLTMRDLALVENRRALATGCFADYDALLDGTGELIAGGRNRIGHATDPVPGPDINQHLRAYDQTLWSIEGTQLTTVDTLTNEPDRRRIPVARGVVTPDGRVVFELFKSRTAGAAPEYLRLRGSTTLQPYSVYTVTFVQRVNYVYTAGVLDASGWIMEIWIKNITAGTPAALDGSYTVAAISTITTGALAHAQNYDIIIGASYVNDGWDHSINMPFPNGVVATPKTSFVRPPGVSRADHGPWPVQQRFMSPYQDQPGNFVVSMFRIWALSLTDKQIDDYSSSVIFPKNQTVALIANLELDAITGTEIPNKSRYPDFFKLGYKSWGMPQGYRNFIYQTVSLIAYLKKEQFEGTWAYEDCLGYAAIDSEVYKCDANYARINGLAAFKASDGQQYGALEVCADTIRYDEKLTNNYEQLYITNHGMLSEFLPGSSWKGTTIGDRTILTSPVALPKVFNGKSCTTAGFKRWNGGVPVVYETGTVPGALTNGWYGVALVYFSEQYGIYQVSPVVTVAVNTTNGIGIYMVPQHPDPRVTLIEVYRTLPQVTRSLAASAPLYKTRIGSGNTTTVGVAGSNVFCETLIIDEADANLSPVTLDRNVTEFPVCAYSAAVNDRLYLAGDVINPDVVYFTDPGNPERLDSFANSIVLPEGSGDSITGMVSEFGTLFVFKPNAIWRIDDIGGNRHQLTRISSVGAVADKSIQTIVNPDTGAVNIFFWSAQGPYLFDGSSPRYIGSPIEQSVYDRDGQPEYSWLNPLSVVVGHSSASREIMCFYSPTRAYVSQPGNVPLVTNLGKNCEAVVYNYRTQSWYRYTGVIGTAALTLNFSGSLTSADPATGQLRTSQYKLILGGYDGKLYAWGTSKRDGLPAGFPSTSTVYSITASAGQANLYVPSFPSTFDITGCSVTVYAPSGEWITAPVLRWENSFIRCDTNWFISDPNYAHFFSYASGDLAGFTVTIGQPPAKIEFPWDEMDMPFYEKDIVELITWHDGNFKYRNRYNYQPLVKRDWTNLSDSNSLNKRTQIKRSGEAIKFEIMSDELDTALDSYAYLVAYKRGNNSAP